MEGIPHLNGPDSKASVLPGIETKEPGAVADGINLRLGRRDMNVFRTIDRAGEGDDWRARPDLT